MALNVHVVIATFGDESWAQLAQERAVPSVMAQAQDVDVTVVHGQTLAAARNTGVSAAAASDWLCFLDADDELEPGYFEAMRPLLARYDEHPLLAPAVRYEDDADPLVFSDRDINVMNPCVIGTLVTRHRFLEAGCFWEESAWDDWSAFRRCWLLGSSVIHVPDAVYRAHSRPAGRNSTIRNPKKLHADIVASHAKWLVERR